MTDTRQSGFSLLEMAVVIVVLSIVAFISFRFVASAGQWYAMATKQNRADDETLAATARIGRELRLHALTTNADASILSFVNRNGQSNTIQCAGGDLTLNGFTLADGVSAFTMTYYDSTNGVLSPLPLNSTNRALIRRISLNLSATDGTAVSGMKVNLFYPRQGTRK